MALTSQTALRADDFNQSIGIAIHLGATTSAYGDLTQVEQSLVYLGVDHVRDEVPGPTPHEINLNRYISLGSFTLNGKAYKTVYDFIGGKSISATMTYLDKVAPYVGSVEGPNEVNYVPLHFTTSTGTVLNGTLAADAYQKELYADVNGDPLLTNAAVLTFSLGPGASYAGYGNVSAYADYANAHAYGSYGVQPNLYLAAEVYGVKIAPSRPYIISETGNFTMPTTPNGVTNDVQAKLEENILLDAFKMGVKQTYLYQLYDAFSDPGNTNHEDHYGVLNFDGTPKPSGVMIHDFTTILADSASNSQSFTTAPLTYSVDGLPQYGNQMVLEKSDGTYEIALWQEPRIWDYTNLVEYVIAPTTVTVTLGGTYQTINVYDLLVGSTPIATYHNVSSIQVALGSSALIVEIEPDTTASTGLYIATGAAGGVFATTGADTVVAGSGAATVNVSGAATITGSTGTLAVNFTGSDATLIGDGGALTVVSNSGNNTITGGSGAFSYTDAGGNDVVTTGTSANNTVVLGSGRDTVTVVGVASVTGGSGAANVTLTGSGASVTGDSGALTVADRGGSNTVTGGTGAFSYTDTAGNDFVTTGTSASNKVVLGGGSDTVSVLAATVLYGGIGNATVTLSASGGSFITGGLGTLTVIDVGSGSNTIVGGAGGLAVIDGNGGDSITGGTGAIAVSALLGGDNITTNNTSGLSVLAFGAGSDTVVANGATSIIASPANLVVSGTGSLSVNGGMGSMTVNGGIGSDYVFTQSGTKNLINLGSGADTVLSHGADTINASTLSGAAAERIYAGGAASITGGAGLLSVNGQGDGVIIKGTTGVVHASAAGDNSYFKGGSAGGNVLKAAGGNTTLVGGGAGDTLSDIGSSGGNLLTAGAGGETLIAGSGNDTLAGGSGADMFVLTAAAVAHTTVIQGYKSGVDTLSFNGFDSTTTPIASQLVVGGSLHLTLADQATVTLAGVTTLS